MKKSRQGRRQEKRQADKKRNTITTLETHCIQLAGLVGEMQVSLNTIYQLLVEKGHMTADEFREKHKGIMLALYPPKKSKGDCATPAKDCAGEPEKEEI
ncbi:uncharacterized protein Dvar_40510 [Desulfosarcina variabilis str. Montpellier]|uniref:hypothetical protein n=1 Tax=Desulfosarcina variabilis TaxID=2300 RepID=UPI003AFAF014